jgi:taurine transport system substrate-binding protein
MAISSRNALLGALAFIAFQAQAVNVTVAYQTSAEPAKVAQADNTLPKRAALPLTGANSTAARASSGR